MIQRLDVVAKHAAPALYNAAEMKRVPLKFLWWPLAKVQEGLGGKARFYAAAAAVGLAALTAAMILVPYPLRMDAKGHMQPVEINKVYAKAEGQVRALLAKPGQKLLPGDPVVELYSEQIKSEYQQQLDKLREAQATERSASQMLSDARLPSERRLEIQTKHDLARLTVQSTAKTLQFMEQTYNLDSNRAGYFTAKADQFDPKIRRPLGASKWTVLDDDRTREAILGRTVRPSEPLLRLGNVEGTWQIEEKIPQRNVGQIARAFEKPGMHKVDAAGRKYLDVDILLRSMPDSRFLGRLYQDDFGAEAVPNKDEHDENEPVVTAYVKMNLDDIPPDQWVPRDQFVTGLEVSTRVRCGDHALGYSLFHGVWEWFYEKVVFFF